MKQAKRISYTLCLCALAGVLPLVPIVADTPGNETDNPLKCDFSEMNVTRGADGRTLTVTFIVQPTATLKSNEVIVARPALVSEDGTQRLELAPVAFAGRSRYRVMKRQRALRNVKDTTLLLRASEGRLVRTISIPFSEWMADGRIVVNEELIGCAECGLHSVEGTVANVSFYQFGPDKYRYDFIEPVPVAVKHHTESFICRPGFPVGQSKLTETFGNNSKELADIRRMLAGSTNIKGSTLRRVEIKGYASPEGKTGWNKELARLRAMSLYEYMKGIYPALGQGVELYIEGVGENWDALRHAVEESSLAEKAEVLALLSSDRTDADRKEALVSLNGGSTHQRLLHMVYPSLRYAEVALRFDVRPYTTDELAEQFTVKPECMSAHEFYMLAQQYIAIGKNPIAVYAKAYECMPTDAVVALNYANALLKYEGNADATLRVLDKVQNDSRSLMPRAISYRLKGDRATAERLYEEWREKNAR